jgi:alkylhydroperoxidase family enzyme
MQAISYSAASVPVRDDLAAAHSRFWERLASPGAWWSGAERVAIAAEVRQARRCRLCRARKESLTPAAVAGRHDQLGALPDTAVEAIHRVVTDPGRLSRKWFQALLAAGLSAEHYVELVGTLAAVISIDSFCRGIGVPLHPLPEPLPGAPSHYRPAAAIQEDAWVPMIPVDRATGAEADLYGGGAVGNVIRALSLVPDEVRTLHDLSAAHYLPMGQVRDPSASRGALNRLQMELIAGRVSALRQCYY